MSPESDTPRFPIRIIFDDGEATIIETPEELVTRIDSIDSTDPTSGVLVRDERDRNVRLKMYGGKVVVFEV